VGYLVNKEVLQIKAGVIKFTRLAETHEANYFKSADEIKSFEHVSCSIESH